MITKQELEKLKELAGKYSEIMCICNEKFDVSNYAICAKIETQYNYAANPDTVLRLIEALEVATEALVFCIKKDEHFLKRLPSYDIIGRPRPLGSSVAQEALNKIYGPTK